MQLVSHSVEYHFVELEAQPGTHSRKQRRSQTAANEVSDRCNDTYTHIYA